MTATQMTTERVPVCSECGRACYTKLGGPPFRPCSCIDGGVSYHTYTVEQEAP